MKNPQYIVDFFVIFVKMTPYLDLQTIYKKTSSFFGALLLCVLKLKYGEKNRTQTHLKKKGN